MGHSEQQNDLVSLMSRKCKVTSRRRSFSSISRSSSSGSESSLLSRTSQTVPKLQWKSDFDRLAIEISCDRRSWERCTNDGDDEWNIYWATVSTARHIFNPDNRIRLRDNQVVSHFPNHYELTRKDLMVKNIKRYRKDYEKQNGRQLIPFIPVTYVLPSDYSLFVEEFRRNSQSTWIMKPTDQAQGSGIFLVTKLSQLKRWGKRHSHNRSNSVGGGRGNTGFTAASGGGLTANKHSGTGNEAPYVISKYITNPLLISSRKFDLRMYVLVTSFRPLVAYEYGQGFARFCNVKYSNDRSARNNQFVHLTNVSIQKTNESYDRSHGGKLNLENLKLFMRSQIGSERTAKVFEDISDIFRHSLKAVQNVMISDKHCFECYGFDIIIDNNLQPWLVEVNASPSLSSTTAADRSLKTALVDDILKIVTNKVTRSDDSPTSIGDFRVLVDEVVQSTNEPPENPPRKPFRREWR